MLKNKIFTTILTIILSVHYVFSQDPQSWINFNQSYYKISLESTAAYELDYNDLIEAGVPISSIDARSLQIFHRGQEIAIRVIGQNDGRLDEGDVIQFLAKRNDGTSDTPLYKNPDHQPHQYFNLFTDESAYFLTWKNDGTNGKRIQEQNIINNTNNLAAENSVEKEILRLFTANADRGQRYSPQNEVYNSAFDLGEGWTGSAFTNPSNFSITDLDKAARSELPPTLEILIQGRNMRQHQTEVLVGPNENSLRSLGTVNFKEYEYEIFSGDLEWTDIANSGDLVLRLVPQAEGVDRISVSYIKVNFQMEPDLNNEAGGKLTLNPNPNGSSYVQFLNTNSTARLYRTDNFNEPVLLRTNRIGSEINTVVQNTVNGVELYLQNQNFLTPSIEKVNFRDFSNFNPDYVILSHPELSNPSGDYTNPVKAYAAYRNSEAGGGYDTLVVDINRIYNQFNYGEISPLAVYRFTQYLVANTKAEMVFIIGKGVNWHHNFYRRNDLPNQDLYNEFVPTAGSPGSDILFGFDLEENNRAAISFGRINAHNSQNVADYLDKIKEMEAKPFDDLRRKHFLNLSGGVSFSEVNRFLGYINDFARYAESPYIGGDYSNLTKETTQVVEFINVADQVNQGLNLITFFGHSGPNTADIDIGRVSDENLGYNNKGKYPFILINGCNAGSFYRLQKNETPFGEDWVNTPEKGSTGVLAHVYLGFPNELKRYSDLFYANAYGDSVMIDQPLGLVHQKTINDYLANFGTNPAPLYMSQAQQMNLLCDPAYKLFPAGKTDYAISDEDLEVVSVDGQPIDALTPEFGVDVIIRNYGITNADSIEILVKRTLPNNEMIVQDTQKVAAIKYQDTVRVNIYNDLPESFGQNIFEVIIDPAGKIPEIKDENNIATINYFLTLGTTLNLYPYDEGLSDQQIISLTAQSVDLLSDERDFLFELDTSIKFNSPYLKTQNIRAKVIAKWETNLLPNENQAYFWRTKFTNPRDGELDEWTISNFTYSSSAQQGWQQNSDDQFLLNSIEGITIGETWSFEENTFNLTVEAPGNSGIDDISIRINGNQYATSGNQTGPCKINTLNLVAFDKSSGVPYYILSNGGFDVLDPLLCGIRPQVINQIRNNQLSQPETYFKKYFDELPDGDIVLMTSYDSVAWNILRANNRAELLDLGASASVIDNLQNGDPYILLGRKGLGAANGIEVTATQTPKSEQTISLDKVVEARFESGSIISKTIGPVKEWIQLDAEFADVEASDDIRLDVFGIDSLNNQTLLFSDAVLPLDISAIDVNQYPQLRLRLTVSDPDNLSPAKLATWKVNFREVPDAVLLPAETAGKASTELAEGEKFNKSFRVVNVTPNNFDEPIPYIRQVFNRNDRVFHNENYTLTPLPADSDTTFSIEVDTRGKVGENDLTLNLNPYSNYNEKKLTNNVISYQKLFEVKKDSLPPFVEVTFDGISILDGDIVSPRPYIQIKLKDENTLINKTDTTGIEIQLRRDCEECVSERINFSNSNIEWLPATDESPFTVNYQPNALEDGNYQLRVQATDASENTAGEEPYKVRFEVINASTITNFYPYPNPFSTSTRFVFTLTGTDLPQEIKIQILTVTGRVVREILQDEIGPIHIGNNITDYAWDGKDEFGDRLANGVYLYRVLVRKDGAFMEQRATAGDRAFTEGYGKLYILR
ncbi:C25 family cysteine peptidase [Marivirga salinae]|uniref:C25 family cysteine peptidase n=1 Tax=Marivirga salinarum TaxID=3059078 RepID=A0AA51RF72_9BACT|nr:C25 family cysteine peptidase [Marivirga sp. BDSF4-3]WMN13005.1 C25 family cysteine peptidase [Marivirga sp. BDSF4-3]